MTLQEFKAWFEGFTEGLHSPPNAKQWARIKARVKEIDGAETSKTVFVDRYWPGYYGPHWSIGGIGHNSIGYQGSLSVVSGSNTLGVSNSEVPLNSSFSGIEAFKSLGCQEARDVQ